MALPNQLSLLRILLAPVFLFLFLSSGTVNVQLSLAVFIIASITDWYDGWHARKFGLISKTGIFLDPLADKVLTSAAFIGFNLIGIMPLWMVIIIVVRDIALTIHRSVQELHGRTLRTSFIAKTKTFIQMTYIFLVLILVVFATTEAGASLRKSIYDFLNSDINYAITLLITALTVYTGITYFTDKNNTLTSPVENN